MELTVLCVCALLAGWVDAVAGGGGLIQIPALFGVFPMASPSLLLGTNKLSSFCGTSVAVLRYRALSLVQPRQWAIAVVTALAGSLAGAAIASVLPANLMRPIVILLVFAVLLFTLLGSRYGVMDSTRNILPGSGIQSATGTAAGLYDGFFGPGTGTFLIYGLVRWGRMDFVRASATAKVINFATNAGALGMFIVLGSVDYDVGLPMALCNVLGGWLGASMAGRLGPRFVRNVFIVVVLGLTVKLLSDWL